MHGDIETIFLLLCVTESKMPRVHARQKKASAHEWIKNGKDGFSGTVVIFNEPVAGILWLCLSLGLVDLIRLSLRFVRNCDHVSMLGPLLLLLMLCFHPEIIIGNLAFLMRVTATAMLTTAAADAKGAVFFSLASDSSAEYFTARDNDFNPIFATFIFIVMFFIGLSLALSLILFLFCLILVSFLSFCDLGCFAFQNCTRSRSRLNTFLSLTVFFYNCT